MVSALLLGKLQVDLLGSPLHQQRQPPVATIVGLSGHLQALWVAVQLGNPKQTVMMNWSGFWIVQNNQSTAF
jgi:hypothetical protein